LIYAALLPLSQAGYAAVLGALQMHDDDVDDDGNVSVTAAGAD